MGAYQKTAKDLAFDRERARLQRQIRDLREDLRKANIKIEADNAVMQHQDEIIDEAAAEIQELKELIGLPKEDLDLILTQAKKTAEAAENITHIKSLLGIGQCLGGY